MPDFFIRSRRLIALYVAPHNGTSHPAHSFSLTLAAHAAHITGSKGTRINLKKLLSAGLSRMLCAHKITPALRSQSVVNLKPALKFDRP
jgi:hypothetical protein